MVAQRAGAPPPPEMLVSGIIPPLADAYFQRLETGIDLKSGLFPGETVVLVHGGESDAVSVAMGGTGKTQLAVEFTQALRSSRAVDVLVWVTASSREAVVAGFARAAGAVGAGDPDADARDAAARFTAWLARTERRWALVLDDLADLADLDGLWPAGPSGQIVITTRLPAAAFGVGAHAAAGGLRIVPVGGFSRREALSYLGSRLTDYPDQRIEALDLAEDLEGLPIGLAQAAAVMNANRLSCQEYRAQFGERRAYMSGRPVEGVSPGGPGHLVAGRRVRAPARARRAGLAGPGPDRRARPARDPGRGADQPGGVRLHRGPAEQRHGRGSEPGPDGHHQPGPGRPGQHRPRERDPDRADAPLRAGRGARLPAARGHRPGPGGRGGRPGPDVAGTGERPGRGAGAGPGPARLRDQPARGRRARGCWGAVGRMLGRRTLGRRMLGRRMLGRTLGRARSAPAHDALWLPEAHPLLFRLGRSLEDNQLGDSAMTYWQFMVAATTRRLGPVHADSLAAKERLAVAFESAGRFGDAIAMFAGALGDRERSHGPEHPDTIAARGRLAHAYAGAGLPAEAVTLYEHMVADSSRQLGLGHPVTLTARAGLADAYSEAGRTRRVAHRLPDAQRRHRTAARPAAPDHAGRAGQPGRRRSWPTGRPGRRWTATRACWPTTRR